MLNVHACFHKDIYSAMSLVIRTDHPTETNYWTVCSTLKKLSETAVKCSFLGN